MVAFLGIDTGGVASGFLSSVKYILYFFFGIFGSAIAILLLLFRARNKKLRYPVLELEDLGNGKFNFYCGRKEKGGWAGKRSYFKGLWFKGDKVFRTKRGEIIHNFSSEDFMMMNGKLTAVCYRDPSDREMLFPINKMTLDKKSREILVAVPSADMRQAAVDNYKDRVRETKVGWSEKIVPAVLYGGLIILVIFAIIFITRYGQSTLDSSIKVTAGAEAKYLDNCRAQCSEAINIAERYTTNRNPAP